MRCHRHIAPVAGTALSNAASQLLNRIGLRRISSGDVAVRGPHDFAVRSVTRAAITVGQQFFGIRCLGLSLSGRLTRFGVPGSNGGGLNVEDTQPEDNRSD